MSLTHTKRGRIGPVAATVAVLAGALLAPVAVPQEKAPDVSRKLAQFVYIEEGTDLIFTVGVRAAALREDEAFFPLEIAVANKLKKSTWKIGYESFALYDERGNRYELPTYPALLAGYDKRTEDTRFFESRAFTAHKLDFYRQIDSNFFPDPVLGVNRTSDTTSGPEGVSRRSTTLVPLTTVELAYRSYLEDVLYFPHPEGKLIGQRLSLEFNVTGLEEPARVAFRIPDIFRKKKDKKKEKD